jgi:hypothetical protein
MGERPKARPTTPWEDTCACGAVFDMRNGAGLCRTCAAEELPPEQVVRNQTAAEACRGGSHVSRAHATQTKSSGSR